MSDVPNTDSPENPPPPAETPEAWSAVDRAQAQEALRKAHERLAFHLENSPLVSVEWDPDVRVRVWSPGAERIFGWTARETIGKRFSEWRFIHEEDLEHVETTVRILIQGNDRQNVLYNRNYRKDGSILHSMWYSTVMRDSSGEVVHIWSQMQDITAQKKAEAALSKVSEDLHSLMSSVPDCLWSGEVDIEGHLTLDFCSPVLERLTGLSSGALIRNPALWDEQVVHPEDRAGVSTLGRGALNLSLQSSVSVEYRILLPNGRVRWIRDNVTFGRAVAGRRRLHGVLTDVTERKGWETELEWMVQDRTEKIRQMERERFEMEKAAASGRMAARIAHEINNPLAGIKNSFQLLKGAISPDYRHYSYVPRIEKEIDRIASIVRQMYSLYRSDREKPRRMQADEIIEDVVALLDFNAGKCQVRLTFVRPAEPVWAVLAEGLVRQALMAVAQNAIEASSPGQEVRIEMQTDEVWLRILVRDWGSGISEEIRDRLFEPFFTTKEDLKTGGLGLGLSVAKGVVESMGGTLSFDSATGRGTVFLIVLPLDRVETPAAP
ncbi:MAG TPA: PAS domain-containing sensor histidine kinase [Candidatus Sumerlaeota bacterium]|nr:PAS domain-containing sensor histidine kinase [Candidatus Sumerlaeota bacterium]